jgi:hypothetical protein
VKRAVFVIGLLCAVGAGASLFLLQPSSPAPHLPEPDAILLPEDEREFLWDAEHAGLELANFGWKPLCDALAAADRETVAAALHPEFRFEWPNGWTARELEGETYHVTRKDPESEVRQTGREAEFIDWLQSVREEFRAPPQVNLKLTAIRPVDRARPEALWEGTGRFTMVGEGESAQRVSRRFNLKFHTVRPEQAALTAGRWLRACQVVRDDQVVSAAPLFADATAGSGIDVTRLNDNWQSEQRPVNSGAVHLCDYNRDGCPDVLLTEAIDFDGLMLYRGGTDGQFVDVSNRAQLPSVPDTIDVILADLNNDGWEDLVLPGKLVYENRGGARFEDRTDDTNLDELVYAVGGEDGLTSLSGVSIVDFDRDGLVDVYVTRADASGHKKGSWIDGRSGEVFGNQLLRNRGDWQFEDVTAEAGTDGNRRSVFTAVWFDANNDRWPDVYVIHEFGSGLLLVNQEGQRFRPVQLDDRSSDFGSMGLSCGDFDNDGWISLYISNMYSSAGNRVMDNLPPGFYDEVVTHKLRRMVSGNQLYRNLGNLQFQGIGVEQDVAEVGWGWGPAVEDFNNDGWLDIYAPCGFMSRWRDKPDG